MRQIILFLNLILFFGCVDVKIKSEIPKKTYYDLDTTGLKNSTCSNFNIVGLGGVLAVTSLNNKNILHKKSSGEISTYGDVQWVDHPKDMIQSMLIKQGYERCISFERSSMGKVKKIVTLEILFLGFLDSSPNVEFAYKITDDRLNVIAMGVIKKSKENGEVSDLQKLAQEGVNEFLELVSR